MPDAPGSTYYECGLESLAKEQWADALAWFKTSAAKGNPDANFQLGRMYEDARGVFRDRDEAGRRYREAAIAVRPPSAFRSEAMYRLGALLLDQGHWRWTSAAACLEEAAKENHRDAQFLLGIVYAQGRGVVRSDRAAIEWWQKAAERGHGLAQFHLGCALADGHGIRANAALGFAWLCVAAESSPDSLRAGFATRLTEVAAQLTASEKEEAWRWARERTSKDLETNIRPWPSPGPEPLRISILHRECHVHEARIVEKKLLKCLGDSGPVRLVFEPITDQATQTWEHQGRLYFAKGRGEAAHDIARELSPHHGLVPTESKAIAPRDLVVCLGFDPPSSVPPQGGPVGKPLTDGLPPTRAWKCASCHRPIVVSGSDRCYGCSWGMDR